MFKRAFTLIEIILVVLITGILFVLLAKVYITASKLYVYHTNLKNVENDLFFINQTLQNLADSSEIAYSKYTNLAETKGFTWVLNLKQNNKILQIYAKNWRVLLKTISWSTEEISPLTNTGTTYVNKLMFKILPYENPYKIFTKNSRHPIIKVFIDIRNRFYNTWNWEQTVRANLQESFNFKYYNY